MKAGESSGELGIILEKTWDFLEKRANMTQEITGALVYPIILFSVAKHNKFVVSLRRS